MGFCLLLLLVCFCDVMLLSKQEGGNKNEKGGGEREVEQLPGKIEGGSYVSKCENYGVFFCLLRFACMLLQKHCKIGVAANFVHY